jgi:hypothetical protein
MFGRYSLPAITEFTPLIGREFLIAFSRLAQLFAISGAKFFPTLNILFKAIARGG